MSIKVTVNEKKESDYPCLKIYHNSHAVVLFTARRTGVVINGNGLMLLGFFGDNFKEDQYLPFHGSITLENK